MDDIRAIQAVAEGTASETEQKRAIGWIINSAAATYENGFVADDPNGRLAAFMDGRAFAGQQIVQLMRLKADAFRKKGEIDK